jgi:hypothetical protein
VSARQVRKTVRALLEDPTAGLSQATSLLSLSPEGLTDIVSDFNFVRGAISGKMLPSALPERVGRCSQLATRAERSSSRSAISR